MTTSLKREDFRWLAPRLQPVPIDGDQCGAGLKINDKIFPALDQNA